ncbi:MAG: helix-turn-helix transcriptional regulator [Paracoccaceae bacterium]
MQSAPQLGDTSRRIGRPALLARIQDCATPIVVIEAPAGTGKSWLLDDLSRAIGVPVASGLACPTGPVCLWDAPVCDQTGPLPADIAPQARLIIAKRADTAMPGLARAEVYGKVTRVQADALLFTVDDLATVYGPGVAAALMTRTGGWACLLAAASSRSESALVEFLEAELLAALPSVRLVSLDVALNEPGQRLGRGALKSVPFMEGRSGGSAPLPGPIAACRNALTTALHRVLDARAGDPVEVRAMATTRAAYGQYPEAIALFQSIGVWQAALEAVRQGGDIFFIHRFGIEAHDKMLAGFPPDLAARAEPLVLARAIQAIKRGEMTLANRILIDRFGPNAKDAKKLMAARDTYGLSVRFFRMLMRTWEDVDIDDGLIEESYKLLAELPASDDLRRGSFYNAVLELYIRSRRFAEAEHVAIRAATHYSRAGVPILSFYIDLHRGIIQLMRGDTAGARVHAAQAGAQLAKLRFDSPGDVRLLQLLNACIAYETGVAEPLLRFLSRDMDALAEGEIWPALLEMALTYGSQALGEHFSAAAARSFLDRWRVTQNRAAQFGRLIDIREVVALQNGNRWQEANARALALDTPVTLDFVTRPGDGLAKLSDRDEVAMALVWLRHLAQTNPTRAGLAEQILSMLDNAHLTGRQRLGAEIWLAYVWRRQRHTQRAEAQLRRTAEQAASQNTIASLSEERIFLADMTRLKRLSEGLGRSDSVRRVLRQVKETGPGRARRATEIGLTRQEHRILHALAEGGTNKAIARLMGLSEATVKFHLSNLYQKLGCATRRDAVATARTRRLLG